MIIPRKRGMRPRNFLIMLTLIGAGACAYFGLTEYSLSAKSSDQPEEISLRDLLQRGPDGNPNIILKDFAIFQDYVYEKKRLSGRWTKVWVPIVPTGDGNGPADKPTAIRVFLFSDSVGSDQEVLERFDRPTVRGMINPHATKPGISATALIKKSYPGTDPETCIIIEEGRQPAGVLKLGLLLFGFVVCIALTPTIWFLARRMNRMEAQAKLAQASQLGASEQEDVPEVIPVVLPVKRVTGRPPLS